MAETTEATSTETGEGTEQETKPEIPAEVQRALRKANKEAETLRLRLKEIEDRDKSEAEKVADRLKDTEGRLSAAETRALRAEVGADKGLPKKLWSRLQGSTEDEMAADADALLETIKPNTTGSFDSGGKQTAPAGDMNSFIRQAAGRS